MLVIIAVGHRACFCCEELFRAIRLAQAAAYPMLLLLSQRFLIRTGEATIETATLQEQEGTPADPRLVQALLALAVENDPDETCRGLTQVAAQALGADVCLLAYPPGENGEITFPCGLDLVQEVDFSAFSIDSSRLPVVAKVLHMGHPVALHAALLPIWSADQALSRQRRAFLAAPVLWPRTRRGRKSWQLSSCSRPTQEGWEEQEAVMQVAGSQHNSCHNLWKPCKWRRRQPVYR
jgi:hypothetical protein